MSEGVICSLITGVISLIGIIVTSRVQNREIMHQLDIKQAVTDTKIEELTREVREHNNFARRVPVLEEKVSQLERSKVS